MTAHLAPHEPLELNHVRVAGPAGAPPLLLLHSLGGTLSQWNPVAELLAAEREVIAVDMPGFGDSPPLPEGTQPSARNLASAVLDFAGTLGLEARPGVAGISLGAWVAIECGRQGGAESVVALCPAGFWREPLAPKPHTAFKLARAIRPLVPLLLRNDGVRYRVLAGNVHDPARVPLRDAIDLVRGYGGARGYIASNTLMRANTIGDLTDVPVPLTLAWAEFDRLVRNRPLPEDAVPTGARQLRLPGCGHVPTWDNPELVSRVILEGTAVDAPAART